MDLDQELAEEVLEYACFLDCGPVIFWLLYKYFNTDQLISHLSVSCKKRVTCQLLYWIVKDSKVTLFSRCLTILHLLKEDHPDVCSQKDWTKLELGIKLKIVLQSMLNGASQGQCVEIFYEQFPDFHEDKTESSNSEEHMLQLLFQLIQQPSVASRNDKFQNEVGSKLIHTIRHRVKHLVVNLNKKLPQPQLEKARLDMWCASGKGSKDFEKFSEKKKKLCEFLQKRAKPTSQQLLQFLEGNNQKELDYDQKLETVERIWQSIPESFAKGNEGKRIPLKDAIRTRRNSQKFSSYCQTFVEAAKETKLAGSSRSHTKSNERISFRHKPGSTVPSVTRLRSSSLISKRGRGDVNAPGTRVLTAPDCTQYDEEGSDTSFFENWPLGLHEGHNTKQDRDFLALYRQQSDHLKHQIDDAEKLINECIHSKSVVKLKRFKSPESLSLYGKQEDRQSSTLMRNDHLSHEDLSKNHKTCLHKKEIIPEIIILSDSDDSSQRVSSRLKERKNKNVGGQDDPVNVGQDDRETESLNSHNDSSLNSLLVGRRLRESKRRHVDGHDDPVNAGKGNRVAERLRSHSGSSLNSSDKYPVPSSISENLNQSKQSLSEDFTDCRENFQSKLDVCRREDFHSRSDFEMQKTKLIEGNDVDRSPARRGVFRKRKSDKKFPEDEDVRVLTSDSDGKESSAEVMIIVGSNCSQSFHHKYDKEKKSLKEKKDEGCKSKSIRPRRKLRRLGTHGVDGEMVVEDPASSSLEKDIEEDEKAKKDSRLSAYRLKPSLKSPDLSSMESVSISRGFQRESSDNDVNETSLLSADKGLIKSPGGADKQMVNASPVFEYKHSSGSSSDKSISLLTGRRILFTADDEFIPHVSIEVIPEESQESVSGYPIDLSDLASFPDGKKNCTTDESDQQVRLMNSSNSHSSSRSEVNSDQVRVISETPPESPDRNVNNESPLAAPPPGNNLTMQSAEYQSDSSSLQHAQRQQTHSFSKSSSDDIQHVSDSEDEDDSPAGQNSQNHPRFPSLVQYLRDEVVESPLRACSVVLQKIKLDKLRLRVLLSQDSQERS